MGDPGMVSREEDVRRIADYVKPWLCDLVREVVPPRPDDVSSLLLERSVRLDEELKGQRFTDTQRFLEQRHADMQALPDKRFEAMDKRFGTMQWMMTAGCAIVKVAVFGLLV